MGPTRERYDVVVLGGGPAGCVLASRLSEDPGRSVCLVEAGPDYGAYAEGRWPKDLLFANELAVSHGASPADGRRGGRRSWAGARRTTAVSSRGIAVELRRMGSGGRSGWSSAGLEPYRRRGIDMLHARPSRMDDLEPFMRAGLDAAAEIGLPLLEDFDDPRALEGAAPIAVNAVGDVRWNAAFAYLDPARERPNLAIMPDALVDRLSFEGDRAVGTIVRVGGHELEIHADVVVLAAGAYGSPAILLRSGVGPADDLAHLSVDVRADLPGVGRNLIDHPRTEVTYRPSTALLTRTHEHIASRPARAQSRSRPGARRLRRARGIST